MKIKSTIILVISFMCIVIVYFVFQNNQLKQIIQTSNLNIDKFQFDKEIEHEQYINIFNHMIENLEITGYTLKDGDTYPGVVIVEQDLTFNKRKVLNLTDEINVAENDSTQKILIYENAETKRQLAIIFAFIPNYMESNMIYCYIPSNYDKSTIELSDKFCSSTINYKNIVITFNQTGLVDTDSQEIFMAIRSVQEQLNKFQ